MQHYTENSSVNHNLGLMNTDTAGFNSHIYTVSDNTHIQNNIYGYSSSYISYNEYRKDTEEILEMFTAAVKELSENERKLINEKFYDLFLNKKIKLKIEINDEEKI
jgi:hypothetical protein